MSKFKGKIEKEVLENLKKSLSLSNSHQLPKLKKIVVNAGIGRFVAGDDKKESRDLVVNEMTKILSLITGQKPRQNRAQKSIAGFKLREGDLIGLSVTLRGERMFHFLEKFVNLALPRVRDFRGIMEKNVSPEGILNIGIKEHIIFPELSGEDFKRIYGLQVTIVPQVLNREHALSFFRLLKIPFQK